MNYANPPGQDAQWTYTGYTIDPNKYGSVGYAALCGMGVWRRPRVVRLGGQKFLVVTDGYYATGVLPLQPEYGW